MTHVLQRKWHIDLTQLVKSAKSRFLVAAPFVSRDGAKLITNHLPSQLRKTGRVEVITDLSPSHVYDGSLDLQAVTSICEAGTDTTLWHIPRFHAKIYMADVTSAIVTSGNLTASGFHRNVECGVWVNSRTAINAIDDHLQDFRATGTKVHLSDLRRYAVAAERVRVTYNRQQRPTDKLTKAFKDALGSAEDELIRLRLAGGAIHPVFARTVHYLLSKYGPLPTIQLHELIRSLHPDLCDDSVDRIIDGKRYGKKWKHAVRTAQQQLKRSNEVTYANGLWRTKGDL